MVWRSTSEPLKWIPYIEEKGKIHPIDILREY